MALPRRPLRVERDAVRLTQVVFILLNNAAKYTDPGGKTWLTVAREAQQAVARVRDNGLSMMADLGPDVFDRFTQGDRTPARRRGAADGGRNRTDCLRAGRRRICWAIYRSAYEPLARLCHAAKNGPHEPR